MKIEQRTPTQLWIQAYPVSSWLIGSILAAIGLIVLGSHALHITTSAATGLISDTTFGSLFLLIGAIALLRGRILRACLDKEAAVLTLSRQGWLRIETETLPLYAIQAVRLDLPQRLRSPAESPSGDRELGSTRSQASLTQYRVVLVLEPSLARSVTLYTASRRDQPQAIAEQVAQFLGIEAEISPGFTDLLKGLWHSMTAARSPQSDSSEPLKSKR